MADAPVLVCTAGARRGAVFAVREGGMGIGRSADNELVIDHPDASRFHARLLYDNGSLWVKDIGSRNGVYVNEARIADHRALKVGDVVRIADTTLEVRWDAPDHGTDPGRPAGGPGDDQASRSGRWWWPFGQG